ncbi:MAG TPA: hypothetical protein VH081_07125 [Solirubrobacteraceae bacterium]|jgi:hypothetical protein|nr:hypothetical protein [Solirubrobacteraceae bacterium]
MASGSAQQPPQEPSRGAPGGAADGSPGPPPPGDERLGPLAILRTRKPDDRALLIYSRVEHDDEHEEGDGENDGEQR